MYRALLLSLAMVAGCGTPYPPEVERQDAALCQSHGAVPNTNAFNDCMARLMAVRDKPVQERNKALEAAVTAAAVIGAVAVVANNPKYFKVNARYSGNCPTPESLDSAGRRCGRRAASYRPGGY